MTDATAEQEAAALTLRPGWGRLALYLMLGFSAGLPFYMFNAVLLLRLAQHKIDIVTVGYFAWVALLPTFKFLWAPLLDRYDIPGFGRFWGKRRGWIMLAQLGIVASMVAMAFTANDTNLPLVAFFAVLLAFWTTTLEIAADAWRIELAPTAEQQGPIVAANLWGYRSAMAGSGAAIFIVALSDWTVAYLVIAAAALVPFPILVAMRPDPAGRGGRGTALTTGLAASVIIVVAVAALTAVAGWVLSIVFAGALNGISAAIGWVLSLFAIPLTLSPPDLIKYVIFVVALLPFIALGIAVPWLKRLPPTARLRRSAAIGPYVDVAWRYGLAVIPILLFVSIYRMGDVMALTLSHPLFNWMGYTNQQIGIADGVVFLVSSMFGVAMGGWLAAKARMGWALAIGAIVSAISNWVFAWLAHQDAGGPVLFTLAQLGVPGGEFLGLTTGEMKLYFAMAVDQFGHGFEGAVFVVYLSMLVNPRFPGAQYALLSGLAFLIPRLLAGLSGTFQQAIGYDGFFIMAGTMSVAAIVFLPFIARAKPRPDDT